VIQRLRSNPRLVSRGQHRQARTEAGTENADPFISLQHKPVNRAFRIQYCLPAHLHRPNDVRADDEVGTGQLGRHPIVVIRKTQTQRRDATARQQP
jgi:hypothetical protein